MGASREEYISQKHVNFMDKIRGRAIFFIHK
jgi:hypothetical protein